MKEKDEVLKAVKAGEFSARKIDPKGKGANITRLKQGRSLKKETIREIYKNLLKLRKMCEDATKATAAEPRKHTRSALPKHEHIKRIEALEKALESLKNRQEKELTNVMMLTRKELYSSIKAIMGQIESLNRGLRLHIHNEDIKRIETLETTLETLGEIIGEDRKPLVLPIFEKAEEKAEEKTENVLGFSIVQKKDGYWYGARFRKKKTEWVYIGKDKAKADQKIKTWLKTH